MGLVLIISAWNLMRVWGGLQFWAGLEKYAGWPGPTYVIVTGCLSALGGLVIVTSLWRRAIWADKALLYGALSYAAWLWVDRLAVQPRLPTNWRFSLVANAVFLICVAAVALDSRNRRYFGREAHEREEQDRKAS